MKSLLLHKRIGALPENCLMRFSEALLYSFFRLFFCAFAPARISCAYLKNPPPSRRLLN